MGRFGMGKPSQAPNPMGVAIGHLRPAQAAGLAQFGPIARAEAQLGTITERANVYFDQARDDMTEYLSRTITDHKFIPGDPEYGWDKQCAHNAPNGHSQCGYPVEDHLQDQNIS